MFPDSLIAKQYQMAKDKAAYIIYYGLSPHFQHQTVARVDVASEYTLSFDEAYNTVIQKGQLDMWIRYFDDATGHVCNEYLTSVFLGHCKAANLLESIKNGAASLRNKFSLEKLYQISMDGPNVNLSFFRQFGEIM